MAAWTSDAKTLIAKRYNAWAAALLIGAGITAYSGSLAGPFVFDDPSSITANATIRHLWPLWDVLATPQANVTVQGRPLLNLSFAINYAVSGADVWSYHVLNLAIHLAAGLTLFGIVRRTLTGSPGGAHSPTFRPQLGERSVREPVATMLGFIVALWWTLHPLQTESVTYVVQRAESLMGLFYLLTIYCFVRYVESPDGEGAKRRRWAVFSILACLAGMGTKEVMVSAPVMVLLFDRTFVAGNFRQAWRQRRTYYGALAATWILLGLCLLRGGGTRGGAIGFGIGGTWWTYSLTQFEAIGRYLLLCVWPHPLVFEYGAFKVQSLSEVLPWAIVVMPLLAGTVWALWRRPVLGFLGAWFFAILAPTSLVPGTSQMIVEHRLYLSLAAMLVVIVCGGFSILMARGVGAQASAPGQRTERSPLGPLLTQTRGFLLAGFIVAVACGGVTAARNVTYGSELELWTDTVAKRPANPVARAMLAEALFSSGRLGPALAEYEAAVKLDPTFFVAQERLGELLLRLGRPAEAAEHFSAALRLRPDFADAHNNLGILLAENGRAAEALRYVERAIELKPEYPEAHLARANVLADLGRNPEAIHSYEVALRLKPEMAGAEYNLANALSAVGRSEEAVGHYRAALRIRPNHPAAAFNLANNLAGLRRMEEAVVQYREAIRLNPAFAEAEMNLGSALFELGRLDEAEAHYLTAMRLDPRMEDIRESLARLRARRRR